MDIGDAPDFPVTDVRAAQRVQRTAHFMWLPRLPAMQATLDFVDAIATQGV